MDGAEGHTKNQASDATQNVLDLDQVTNTILTWEKHIVQLEEENRKLSEKLKSVSHRNAQLESSIAGYEDNKRILKDSLDSLQCFIDKRMGTEVEVEALKAQLVEAQSQAKAEKDSFMSQIDALKTSIRKLQADHRQNLKNYKTEMETTYKNKEQDYEKELHKIRMSLESESACRHENDKKHETEIMKMQMEYEAKITIIQSQSNRMQLATSNNISSNTEIFRKKLQHVQDEANREIASLKSEIARLKLAQNMHKPQQAFLSKSVTSTAANVPTVMRPSILKRKRQMHNDSHLQLR